MAATVGIEGSDLLVILMLVLLEGLLSADNAMVLAVLVLGLPKQDRGKALRYGILGAFGFRAVATLAAVYLLHLNVVKLLGAAIYLSLPSAALLREGAVRRGRRTPPKARPWLGLSAFWATVVKVELTDIVFALDSILVAVAMSPKLWVILTGGILGIIMMRMVITQLLALIQRYPALVDGAFVIIAWVGARLLVHYLHAVGWISWDIPEWLGYTLIVTIFVVALAWARIDERRRGGPAKADGGEQPPVVQE